MNDSATKKELPMIPLLFKNARIFDGTNPECPEGMHVLLSDGLIREVSERPVKASMSRCVALSSMPATASVASPMLGWVKV